MRKRLNNLQLKKDLGLLDATFYGIWIIIGAGIFVLLGKGAGLAGNSVWLSFVIAALIAAFTGLSYCELSSRFPKESAEYIYTKKAFGWKSFSFIIGWVLVFAAAFSASTVAIGFAGYFSEMFGTSMTATAVVLLLFLSLINFYGIRESSKLNIVFALMEVLALVIVIAISLPYLGSVNYFETPQGLLPLGLGGVAAASSLIFFAYIGFDTIPKISEETKNAKKTIPKALVYSLSVSTVFYIIVAISAVSVLPWEQLAVSSAPLADVVLMGGGPAIGYVISIIALFATFSTVLVILIAGSRMIYGMAKEGAFPEIFSYLHPKRRTPFIAVFIIMVLSMLFVYTGNIEFLASMTNLGIFIAFLFVNLSLIVVRMKTRNEPPFRAPLNIGRFPLLALFGAIASVFLILQFETVVYLYEVAVIVVGVVVYKFFGFEKKKKSFGGLFN